MALMLVVGRGDDEKKTTEHTEDAETKRRERGENFDRDIYVLSRKSMSETQKP